jgi:exosortase
MAADKDNISGAEAGERRAPRYRYSSGAGTGAAASDDGRNGVAEASVRVEEASRAAAVAARVPRLEGLDWNRTWIALAGAGLCLIALFPSELMGLQATWYSDPGWSHGFVVPLISLFLIRTKWETLKRLTPKGVWLGLAILLVGVVGQILYRVTGTTHMSTLSILVVLMGLVLFVLGWDYLKILWLPIGYLVFAIPPPKAMYSALTIPMQQVAAEVGVWFLPLFGCEAHRMSTIIQVMRPGADPVTLEVEQACSGMRMLVAFLALAVALAYSTARPMWQKVFLAFAAVPIAIFCNALRVTMTGVMVAKVNPSWGEGNAHAYFGLLMLIPAMFMQLGLAWVLENLFIEDDEAGPKTAAAGGRA